MNIALLVFTTVLMTFTSAAIAEDAVELETTFIKGNKELPQIIYIVPWQSIEKINTRQEKLVLHSLFGDIFDPVTSKALAH
ncbi:MAG: hypothetical protein L3J89_11885 [Gammaproteobacteria bacterium]|nr:hypothetical protein [Gammaproteobacteria bacterium]